MVNQLRSEIHLSYDTCTDNAVLVLTSLLDFMEERSVSSLDLHTLQVGTIVTVNSSCSLFLKIDFRSLD